MIEDYVSAKFEREIGTMASVASRRLTVVRLRDGKTRAQGKEEDAWQRGEFCSEPPPDAMVAVTGQWAAKLSDLKGVEVDTEFVQSVASSMGPLLYRSQGLQWNRDNMAYVCNAYMNRRMSREKYIELVKEIMTMSKELIALELKNRPPINVNIEKVEAPALVTDEKKQGSGNEQTPAR